MISKWIKRYDPVRDSFKGLYLIEYIVLWKYHNQDKNDKGHNVYFLDSSIYC